MNVSGLVVRVKPEFSVVATADLGSMAGVEVHACGEDGRMVVTVESANEPELTSTVLKMHDRNHVLSISMIYHHFDDETEADIS